MSYDFNLSEPQEDRSSEQIDDADSEELGIPDPEPAKEERKKRVTDRLIAKSTKLAPFSVDFEEIAKSKKITVEEAKKKYRDIELNGPEDGNGIQITLSDDEAFVTVPYWHQGAEAFRVFEEVWSYLEIIELEAGYLTDDPQIGRVLDLRADFDASLACYQQVIGDMKNHFSAKRSKRWWEFWK